MNYKKRIKKLLGDLSSATSSVERRRLKVLIASIEDKIFEETDIGSDTDLLDYLKNNPGQYIYLDTPVGHAKSFGGDNKKLPFHYGEFPELINPSDDMGWDIIIVPSQSLSGDSEVEYGHALEPVGIVRVNPSKKDWSNNTKSDKFPDGKPPPIGNDKIVLAKMPWSYKDDKRDVEIISDFFDQLWQFGNIEWYK